LESLVCWGCSEFVSAQKFLATTPGHPVDLRLVTRIRDPDTETRWNTISLITIMLASGNGYG